MLSIVATNMNRAARQVTLNHPNSIDCLVSRKMVTRTDQTGAADGTTVGGLPLLGGLPILATEDEADVDYTEMGEGKCMLLGPYGGTNMLDNGLGADVVPNQEARVESLVAPGEVGHFEVERGDLVMLMPGMGVVLAFEVLQDLNTVNIPPYVRKVLLGAQDDLNYIPGVGGPP